MDTDKPGTGASDFTKEEVERRALEAARRLLATPKKPNPKAFDKVPASTQARKPGR